MLVNCPKCGLSQPKDRYCAKCGIDMETYKPAEPSMSSQILMHPALHIAGIAVVVFMAVAYIRGRQKESFLEQVEKMPTGVAVVERNQPQSKTAAVEPTPEMRPTPPPTQTQTAQMPAPPSGNTAVPGSRLTGTPAPALTEAASSGAARGLVANQENQHQTKVKVIYAEVDDLTLKKWIPEMQAAGQYMDSSARMGLLPQIEKKIAEDRSIVVLETVHKSFDRANPSSEWFVGKNTEQGELGLKASLLLQDPEGPQIKGELRIVRTIESSDPKMIESEFEIPAKGGWVIWRALNPKINPAPDLLADMKSFFQIYKSARFKSGRSDFTIFLVFDTPSAR